MTKQSAVAVVGANWGDEGKGLFVDYFSSKYNEDAVVVRYSGGAQAGHTVVTPDGKRHVFSHFGSGTFNGSPTYLSDKFIANPILMAKELETLKDTTQTWLDELAIVTTPYDIIINQITEEKRGDNRHGSCGAGINETYSRVWSGTFRATNDLYRIYGLTLKDKDDLKERLLYIKNKYVPFRLRELGIREKDISDDMKDLLNNETVIEKYLETVDIFLSKITLSNLNILTNFKHIIFEGSQGLGLDESIGVFPFLTRGNVGKKEVYRICRSLGIRKVDVMYVTRSYTTRHGRGPLPRETKELPYSKVVDETNVPNKFQESLRFGYLDLSELKRRMNKDQQLADPYWDYGVTSRNHICITCLDQIDDDKVKRFESPDPFEKAEMVNEDIPSFLWSCRKNLDTFGYKMSFGPTRDCIL